MLLQMAKTLAIPLVTAGCQCFSGGKLPVSIWNQLCSLYTLIRSNFLCRVEGLGIFEVDTKTVNSKIVFMSLKGSTMDKIISAAEMSGWICVRRMHWQRRGMQRWGIREETQVEKVDREVREKINERMQSKMHRKRSSWWGDGWNSLWKERRCYPDLNSIFVDNYFCLCFWETSIFPIAYPYGNDTFERIHSL